MESRQERYLQFAERLVALIRPKFYNRLTWVIVLAGLLLMSSPWWLDLVGALSTRVFGIVLPSYESHIGFGLALVALGLAYHLTVHYINELISTQREATTLATQRDHDRKMFEAFVGKFSESDLAYVLADLQNQHAYVSAQGIELDDAVQHLLAPATQFINTEVIAAARRLGLALRDLRHWAALNFFPHGSIRDDGGYRFCLHPELSEDRSSHFPSAEEHRKYDEFAQELYSKVDATQESYGVFRSTVKKVLAV